jgi:hypothetical protein
MLIKTKVPLFSHVSSRNIKIGTEGEVLGTRLLKEDPCRMYLVKFKGVSWPESVREDEVEIYVPNR